MLLPSGLPVVAAPRPPSGPALTLDRVVLSVPEIRDSELRSRLTGAGNTTVERSVTLTLVARAASGDPGTIVRLQRLTAVDERGRLLTPPRQVPFNRERAEGLAPDDRRLALTVAGLAGDARRVTVEGELVLAPDTGEQVLPFRLPALDLPLSRSGGTAVDTVGTLSLRLPVGISGAVTVGLSRKEGSGWGPWRWLSPMPSAPGVISLSGIAPGTYRISGRTENGVSLRTNAPIQVMRGMRGTGTLVR